MSLHPAPIGLVPEETARIARAAFRKGNLCLRIREELGTIYQDELFTDLFSHTGQPAEAPWRLALVCILQYLEDLSDRQAAEAVRARIDWKYLLGLELADPGFDFTLLTEFRTRLLTHEAKQRIFDHLVKTRSRAGLDQEARSAAHGLHPCAGCRAPSQSLRTRRRKPCERLLI
jgi:transposase